MPDRRYLLLWLFLPACSLALSPLAGCTPKNPISNAVELKGRLTKAGAPLEVKDRALGLGQVTLEFIPLEAGGGATQTFTATADAAGDFTFPGGIPAGKYKVAVRQWDPYPEKDLLAGRFAPEKTPLVRTVDGGAPIVIDLDQP